MDDTRAWLDVAELEDAVVPIREKPGERLAATEAKRLQAATRLYSGALLEGCYSEWCLFERERVQAMYLASLEKLLGYCEAHGAAEEGLAYGEELLRHDRAHERAHWRMMRLHYLRGERTAALRQFSNCRSALASELGVEPSESTQLLYSQIRDDVGMDQSRRAPRNLRGRPSSVTDQLKEVRRAITEASGLLDRAIVSAEHERRPG